MSEPGTRYAYREDRVIIEASRVLQPPLAGATVQLTGAQVEMLRNITQYLRRPNTYAKKYSVGYYNTPTVEQFDSIQAIVADLEEKLMGDENTLWGYSDTYEENGQEDSDVAGTFQIDLSAVPAGEVWNVEGVGVYRTTNAPGKAQVQKYDGVAAIALETIAMGENAFIYPNSRPIVLKEDQYIIGRFQGATIGETCILTAWGYKMTVPT